MVKDKATAEEWRLCMEIIPKTLDAVSKPTDEAKQREAVECLYALSNYKSPRMIHVRGPIEMYWVDRLLWYAYNSKQEFSNEFIIANARTLCDPNGATTEFLETFKKSSEAKLMSPMLELWGHKVYLGWLQGGEILGVPYDQVKYEQYTLISHHLDMIIAYDEVAIICAHPIKCVFGNNNQGLHCEDGPALVYADGYELYCLEGIIVPKNVVLDPTNQTLDEINSEDNAEVKRIRIGRLGWEEYIRMTGGHIVDTVLGGPAWETLVKCQDYNLLSTFDPSTGRPYELEVSGECTTCEEAQRYLLAPDAVCGILGLDPSEVPTRPLVRT